MLCLLLAAVCSCAGRIQLADEADRNLVMNAILSTSDSVHTVYVCYGSLNRLSSVPDCTVKCYVNGGYVSSGTLGPSDSDIEFKAFFGPGDEIRLEAETSDGDYAKSVVVAPSPGCVSKASFDTVRLKLPTEDNVRDYLRIISTVSDIKNESDWYRISLLRHSKAILTAEGTYSRYREGQVVLDETLSLKTFNYLDPVLYSGISLSGDEDIDKSNYFSNTLNIFSDSSFENGECDMSLLVQPNLYSKPAAYSGGDEFLLESEIIVRLSAMSRDSFNYLNAFQLESSDAAGIYLICPYPFPSNVAGGLGYVAVFSDYDYVLKLPDKKLSEGRISDLTAE